MPAAVSFPGVSETKEEKIFKYRLLYLQLLYNKHFRFIYSSCRHGLYFRLFNIIIIAILHNILFYTIESNNNCIKLLYNFRENFYESCHIKPDFD